MVFMAVQYHQYCLNRLKRGFNNNCIYDCGAINTKYKKIPTRRTEHWVVVVILHNCSWQFVCNKMEGCETDKGLIINCLLKCILLKKACHSLSKFIFYFYILSYCHIVSTTSDPVRDSPIYHQKVRLYYMTVHVHVIQRQPAIKNVKICKSILWTLL